MRLRWIFGILMAFGCAAHAQDSTAPGSDISVALAPVIVTSSFEMPREPGTTELAIRALSREMEQKQKRDEEVASAPVRNARFWSYIPFRLGLPDAKEFFIPNYSTPAYRAFEIELQVSEKQSLFTR